VFHIYAIKQCRPV